MLSGLIVLTTYIASNITKINDKREKQKDGRKVEIKKFRKRRLKKWSKQNRLFSQSAETAII